MHGTFYPTEWNALVNRACAQLAAQRRCRARQRPAGPYPGCPFGGGAETCRSRFRHTTRRLASLIAHAPEPYHQKLRRTIDHLGLSYHAIWGERES